MFQLQEIVPCPSHSLNLWSPFQKDDLKLCIPFIEKLSANRLQQNLPTVKQSLFNIWFNLQVCSENAEMFEMEKVKKGSMCISRLSASPEQGMFLRTQTSHDPSQPPDNLSKFATKNFQPKQYFFGLFRTIIEQYQSKNHLEA